MTIPFFMLNSLFGPAVASHALGFNLLAAADSGRAAFGWLNWTVVAVYLAGMIGVGWWFMKREASGSTEAYFRGGQRVPWWVAGLSIFATMLSSLTFMGIPARAYHTDLSWYIGQLPILFIVPLVAFCYLPFFIMQQLPVGVSGLVIAAIFAASQSTVSSSLNSVATVFSKDFLSIQPLIHP